MTGLYIHIPICISRCRYCDFYKVTPNQWDDVALYLDSLEKELARLPKHFAPDTIFIGGGTPSALSAVEFSTLLESINRRIDMSNVVEFTSEANPGSLTVEKLQAMKDGGINRVSIGVQTFNDKALGLLGRRHKKAGALEAYSMLRQTGFDNVNIDLIQSIPGMSPADVLSDAQQVIDLGPEHISYYNLIYEPGTPMTIDRDAGRLIPPTEDEEADNYYAVKALLKKAGYDQYEISNFSKDKKYCLHNVLYWQGGEYFGCGPSGHSHWNGKRFGNVRDLKTYCDQLQAGENAIDFNEELPSKEKARETLVMWLRMTDGVDLAEFEKVSGFHIDALCGDSVASMMEEGLMCREDNSLKLTENALFVCNAVFSELV